MSITQLENHSQLLCGHDFANKRFSMQIWRLELVLVKRYHYSRATRANTRAFWRPLCTLLRRLSIYRNKISRDRGTSDRHRWRQAQFQTLVVQILQGEGWSWNAPPFPPPLLVDDSRSEHKAKLNSLTCRRYFFGLRCEEVLKAVAMDTVVYWEIFSLGILIN